MGFGSRLVLCGCVLAVAVTATAASNLYRYRDSNGTVVIGASVPPEYVKHGYEILSSTGRVLEVVPRAPTPEEIAAREAAEEQARQERELAKQRAAEDALLLRLYGGPEGALQVRDRRLQELGGIISIKRGNLQVATTQIEETEAQAAAFERSGREVPEDLHANLQRLQNHARELEREVAHSEAELENVKREYELKIDRLRQLKAAQEEQASIQ